MLYNINDQYIGRSFDCYGEYSQGEIDLFEQVIAEGQMVLDVGANIGSFTVYFARKVGVSGMVHAFEPQRLVFQTLCANIALNSFAHVYCHPCALGVEPGNILVPQVVPWGHHNFGGLALGEHDVGDSVPVLTLDDLQLHACHFIKIDVEGMELAVLQGGQQLLQRCAPVLYVENDRQEKAGALVRFLDKLGYEMYWHMPLLYNPDNFFQNRHNTFGNIGSHNMLCLPKSAKHVVNGFPKVEVPA